MNTELVLFWVMAPISVGSAIAMLLQRSAVYAALLLVVNFFTLAIFFLMLDAPFLFAVQIIVYAGAIMVLFLFVIMLLGVDRKESLIERLPAQRPFAILFALLVAGEIFFAVRLGVGLSGTGSPAFAANGGGSTQALARVLFHDYFFPFEVTSVLLIVAAIAAIVMAGRTAGGEPSDPIAEEQLALEASGSPPPLPKVEEPERVP